MTAVKVFFSLMMYIYNHEIGCLCKILKGSEGKRVNVKYKKVSFSVSINITHVKYIDNDGGSE